MIDVFLDMNCQPTIEEMRSIPKPKDCLVDSTLRLFVMYM
ncbi:hypothetical protein IQ10_00832 [Halalkalibacter nanhaiisediminis]|uniref:Uncharacterized protein n=1 Tax=Halalkalibacter nanhaiisediminis TaxID=688079 RepID=A0A562QSG2_9BACI|nr:hypothetical protein IQ10_00832 [Halalkalibacter nanhaiisediminis]